MQAFASSYQKVNLITLFKPIVPLFVMDKQALMASSVTIFVISVLAVGVYSIANLNNPIYAQQNQNQNQRHIKSVVCCPNSKGIVLGQPQTFVANLTGKNEVPPVNTGATGSAKFQLNREGNLLTYQLSVSNVTGIVGAHIHTGTKSENGAIVVALYNPANTIPPTGKFTGILSNGTIRATDLRGPLLGKTLTPTFTDLMKRGQVYVNINTLQNKNGEIRGQIVPSP